MCFRRLWGFTHGNRNAILNILTYAFDSFVDGQLWIQRIISKANLPKKFGKCKFLSHMGTAAFYFVRLKPVSLGCHSKRSDIRPSYSFFIERLFVHELVSAYSINRHFNACSEVANLPAMVSRKLISARILGYFSQWQLTKPIACNSSTKRELQAETRETHVQSNCC